MIVLPVGHEQTSVRRWPWVTFGLMALCLAAHLVSLEGLSAPAGSEAGTMERYGALADWGLVPAAPAPWSWLTHMFLHVGWLHLAGNLLILYLAGPFLEDVWGRPLFASFYLTSGLAGALLYVGGNPEGLMPLVGASGAIAGLMGGFLVRYGIARIRLFYWFLWLLKGTVAIPAWILLPLWFVHQLTLAVVDAASGIAYWAHVGGFAAGTALALAIHATGFEARVIAPALSRRVHRRVLDNPRVERGLAARGDGDVELALVRLAHAVEREPGNPDAARALWSVAVDRGRGMLMAPRVIRAVAEQLRGPDPDAALDLWTEMLASEPRLTAEPGLMLQIGLLLADRGSRREAQITWRRALDRVDPPLPAALALRLARSAFELDPLLALDAVERALADPDADDDTRNRARALHDELRPREAQVVPATTEP